MLPRPRWSRVGAAVVTAALAAGSAAVVMHVSAPAGVALGPVQPITPVHTSPQLEAGTRADVSRRGEAVTAVDQLAEDRGDGAFVGLDNTTIEAPFDAGEVGVSGDGCVAAYVLAHTPPPPPPSPPPPPPPPPPSTTPPVVIGIRRPTQAVLGPVPVGQTRIATIDRCNPANSRLLAEPSTDEEPFGQPAVNHDGSVVVVPSGERVMRFDIGTSVVQTDMPLTDLEGWYPLVSWADETNVTDNAVDVSSDGSVVVAALYEECDCSNPDQIVVAWSAGATTVEVLSTPDGSAQGRSFSPSVSGDGSFVSFVSTARLAGQPASAPGPFVYVRRLTEPVFTLVSPADQLALYSSLSEDGSQVAFVRTRPTCTAAVVVPGCVADPELVVSVVWSPTPGLTGPRQIEDVNRSATGEINSLHLAPVLSGSGRYVAWETQGGETLLGMPFPDTFHVVMRQRDAGFRVDDLAFGTRPAGSSTAATTVVTNTGRSSILPGEIVTTSPSFTVVGGTCGVDVWIPPGATCTVTVRFDAPGAPGTVTGQLVVREVGHEALTATARLDGQVAVPDPEPEPDPEPTPTVTLSAAPNPLDFGPVAILISTGVAEVTVANGGNVPAPVQLFLSGEHRSDFEIVSDSCRATPLAPGRTCVVRLRMTASAGGPRTATLDVVSGSASTAVGLRGEGRLAPQLAASPAAVTERGITTIVGQGFVPGEAVSVVVDGTTVALPVTVAADGTFQTPLPVFGRLPLGPYQLVVGARPGFYDEVRATLLVGLGTYQPQGPTTAVFRTNTLVVRGQ